ncbi:MULTISPECIES: glutamate ABC transporter substrate-binding protein [Microbacterium]|uniref:glutamate ABC transporter substrate-binding protein n=1 Tax=Microbacterium TaxID=33882 RepID=UPI0006FE2D16|nr:MULTISPECIES: glutamate ABC transporter substrate-binding protein [Microbacterium]KAA0959380.1 glutamate ABC transporter substrate-binding protein [Microbacterium sp. ANT_H45B]KQZ22353.1 ABC transporter substrate-binding protein [Microbacterium sp. Root553]MCP1430492.1 glutamate transport system substrate-binding protein [Microbacterium foliorum]CAH0245089.1 ABC transporter glutamine-binding protein GlnH [Microbacterium foliorum]CAH0253931.1 ABC transporter glutamine-binding protein GlnH [M
MRRTRTLAGIGIAAAALLALTACNSGTPSSTGAPEGGDEGDTSSSTPWTVLTDVSIDGSPTFDRIESAGTIKVGVKEDQPGLGYLDPVTNERTGFDVDIARWMAASLGVDPEKIEFQAIASANREQAIVNGDIDYYVGTYSITDKRKEQISFAGPYFVTGQGLLVGADSDIKSVDDLSADTTVCSATGSTPIQNIKTNYPDVPTKEYDTYSKCVEDLKNGQVDAVTTDEAILIGYAAQDPDKLKVVGEPFSEERYGIGLAKGDDALAEYFNTQLTDGGEIWQQIFDNNLGASGVKATQPEVDPIG